MDKIATTHALNIIAPQDYTYYPYNQRFQPDILDIIISKNFTKNIDQLVLNELDSDHLPVLISWTSKPHYILTERLINGIVDWDQFMDNLNINITQPTTTSTDEIDEQITTYTNNIISSIRAAMKPKRLKPKLLTRTTPNHILQLINKKNRLRRQHQKIDVI